MHISNRIFFSIIYIAALILLSAQAAVQHDFKPDLPPEPHAGHAICTRFGDLQWKKDNEHLGDRSPESVLLRLDEATHASEWMVRLPPGFRLPMHWHSANQTHTVISGTYVMRERGGDAIELPPNSFNYTPARLVHEGWVKGDEPVVLFVTFDARRDNHIADQTPPPAEMPHEKFICIRPDQAQWRKFEANSAAEFAMLHEHPRSKATHMLIRCPPGYYVPKHWHSADETHMVLEGSFIVNCNGRRVELEKGSYNRFPARLIHNARMGDREATTLLVSTNKAWDVHWVEPPSSKHPSDAEDVLK